MFSGKVKGERKHRPRSRYGQSRFHLSNVELHLGLPSVKEKQGPEQLEHRLEGLVLKKRGRDFFSYEDGIHSNTLLPQKGHMQVYKICLFFSSAISFVSSL